MTAHVDSFRLADDAGVRIAMGTDCPASPHGTNLRELELVTKLGGMSGGQALVAATSSAAGLLGLDADLGTIEPGKVADLVIIDGDPDEVADLAGRIRQVWLNGDLVRDTTAR